MYIEELDGSHAEEKAKAMCDPKKGKGMGMERTRLVMDETHPFLKKGDN